MTKREKLIVSAYTGFMMVTQKELKDFLKELLGREVLLVELENKSIQEKIRDILQPDFIQLCKEDTAEPRSTSDAPRRTNDVLGSISNIPEKKYVAGKFYGEKSNCRLFLGKNDKNELWWFKVSNPYRIAAYTPNALSTLIQLGTEDLCKSASDECFELTEGFELYKFDLKLLSPLAKLLIERKTGINMEANTQNTKSLTETRFFSQELS